MEAEIRFSENRVRRDIMERDRAWRELVMTGVPLFANLLARVAPLQPARGTLDIERTEPSAMLPPAALERQPVDVDQFHAYAPGIRGGRRRVRHGAPEGWPFG